MFKNLNILIIMVFMTGLIASSSARQMHEPLSPGSQRLAVMVDGNDTVYLAFLRDIYVFPKVKFKNKKQEETLKKLCRMLKL